MRKCLFFIIVVLLSFTISERVSASTSSASSYVLMDMTTGRVLDCKDMNSKRLIASITKIMTATIALESGKVEEVVEVDDSILKAYGSGVYIEVGEEIKLKDLLYGLMLRSGNDAAVMIASYVAGSEEEFVKLMNNKAKELGMKNTIFYNASGLPRPHGNYSSAYDMALLTSYAMKNDMYREIVKTKDYKVTTNKKTYVWHNKNKLLRYDYITGGKTGYTEESGRTLVSTADIGGMKLVVVTIRDSDDWNTHRQLYDYVKGNYNSYQVLSKDKFTVIGDSYYDGDTFYIKNDVYLPLKKSEKKMLINHISLEKKKKYNTGDKVGVSQIYMGEKLLYEEDIYIIKGKSLKRKSIFTKIKEWFND